MISAGLPKILEQISANPIVSAIGIYNPSTGTVDIDTLYNAFVPHLGSEKIPIAFPKMGAINLGTIKLGKEEIDALVRYIREA